MRLKWITAIALSAMAIISCDETTEDIGSSLTGEADKLAVSAGHFNLSTRSVRADSVYSHENNFYLGRIKDPETGAYVKTEFMTQFNMLPSFFQNLPDTTQLINTDQGMVCADSCEIFLYINRDQCYGDSLTPIKIKVSELAEPADDNQIYYTNYDPKAKGLIREGGLQISQMFTLSDLTVKDSIRKLSSYYDQLTIRLNGPYTDKNGVTYNNYGTYLMRKYLEHPEYFKNSHSFVHNVCPGFYFEVTDGLGMMAKFYDANLRFFFSYKKDTITYVSYVAAASTNEVLQTMKVTNDRAAMDQLVNDDNCTYLKTPAGIFTEVTLPVDEIMSSHPTDSLLSASVTFQRLNAENTLTDYTLDAPPTLLMVHKDSLQTFFEDNRMTDNRYCYSASLSKNVYQFTNIANLITLMYRQRAAGMADDPQWLSKHPDWNKAMLVPISLQQSSTSSSSGYYYSTSAQATTIGMHNEIGLYSTRLAGGTSGSPVVMDVIFAKFKE